MATDKVLLKNSEQEEADARRLALRYRAEYVDLKSAGIDHDLFRTIQVDLMFRYNFVPMHSENGTLEIAIADPRNLQLIDELSNLLGKKLKIKVATLSQISDLLKKTEQSQRVLEEVTEGFTLDVVAEDNPEETLSIDKLGADSSTAPVIRLVDTTIFNALERRASDIHIETRDQEVAIKYRIDGVLHYAMPPIAKDWHSAIISRIKVMSELDIAERRVPQDGRFRVRYKGRLIDFRVSIMPTVHGEDSVLRVLDKESMSEKFARLSLEVVGFSERDVTKFRRYIKEPYGMVLVTGPTGSGKTTTLYAALNELNRPDRKIITAEDPVEYYLPGINQVEVRHNIGLDFAKIIRAMLRQAPNIILVGEIRDHETAEIAIQASLTGHLVFSTLHTNDAPSAVTRLVDIGVQPFLVASSVIAIMAQRLVRMVCQKCKGPDEPSAAEIKAAGLSPERVKTATFQRGTGCNNCNHTGYRGRKGIFEMFRMTSAMRELTFKREPTQSIRRQARLMGMRTLLEDGINKACTGLTTLDEVLSTCHHEHE